METKESLEQHFHQLLHFWKEKHGTHPKAPWDEEMDPILYLGYPDEEEYVYWKPVEKVRLDDFWEIEKVLGFKIHISIKEYFNSYWFLNLQGFYGSQLVHLEPVEPGKNLLEFFQVMKQYEENKGKQFRYIQIGFISPEDMVITVDNETGQVFIENVETEENELLANSLVELIKNLKIKIE